MSAEPVWLTARHGLSRKVSLQHRRGGGVRNSGANVRKADAGKVPRKRSIGWILCRAETYRQNQQEIVTLQQLQDTGALLFPTGQGARGGQIWPLRDPGRTKKNLFLSRFGGCWQ